MLFLNPVVSHTRITHLRGSPQLHRRRGMHEVSGTLHNTVLKNSGTARRDVARCRQAEPLRITISAGVMAAGRVARRRLRDRPRQPIARAPGGPFGGRGGGPIGVVKLLRARGGCLGVIRFRAWKAAKSPGELPNER